MSLQLIRKISEEFQGFVKLTGQSSTPTKDIHFIEPLLKMPGAYGYMVEGKSPTTPWMENDKHYPTFVAAFDSGNPAARGLPSTAEYILATGFVNTRYVNQSGVDLCKKVLIEHLAKNPASLGLNSADQQSKLMEISQLKPRNLRQMLSKEQGVRTWVPLLLKLLPIYGLRCEFSLDANEPIRSRTQFLFLNEMGIKEMRGFVI